MPFLDWQPEYSVGVDAVDDEHREMIDQINMVYEELDEAPDEISIENFLGDIHAGIAMHFALEEQLMRSAGYDEYEAHKADHEELLDQIREMMDILAADPDRGFPLLRRRLSDWFRVHFATFDARLHGKLGPHGPAAG